MENREMREVSLKIAADAFDDIVAEAMGGEDVVLTRDGRREAVVISWASWERLSRRSSFGRLLASSPLEDADIALRHHRPGRDTGL